MIIDEGMWNTIQKLLKYTDEEMVQFKDNPVNEKFILKLPEVMNKIIVIEVIRSHGCISQHNVGDKLYLDYAANIKKDNQ